MAHPASRGKLWMLGGSWGEQRSPDELSFKSILRFLKYQQHRHVGCSPKQEKQDLDPLVTLTGPLLLVSLKCRQNSQLVSLAEDSRGTQVQWDR